MQRVVLWSVALVVSMPFLVAVYRKLKSLALLLAEVSVQPATAGRFTSAIRYAISDLVPVVSMVGVFLLVAALSGGILPPTGLLVAVLVCAALLLALVWRWCVKIHAAMQIALRETFEEQPDPCGLPRDSDSRLRDRLPQQCEQLCAGLRRCAR